ncbi:hypothetical protein RKD32_002179 [Streptomyces sp. SAI-195]
MSPTPPACRSSTGSVLRQLGPHDEAQHHPDHHEDDEHAPPVRHAQDLPADERRDDRRDAGDQHQGGEEAGHGHAVVQVAYDGPGDDYPGGARESLDQPEGDEDFHGRRDGAQRGGDDVDGETGQQRTPAPPLVAHRADHDLAEGHAGQAGGERQLDGRGRRAQGPGDLRERGEVHVHRQRRRGGQAAEDQGDEQTDAPGGGQCLRRYG